MLSSMQNIFEEVCSESLGRKEMKALNGKARGTKENRKQLKQEWILLSEETLEILLKQYIAIISTPKRENGLSLLKVEKKLLTQPHHRGSDIFSLR